ncbi:MAG TPA: diphosphomevalonate decarboxylase [Caldithrix abyssi]|uniref:diphosphomevalonate decarboxylase n=1 Tax=Caldithrix abyssi TaxID=187145 RepID=A0A7V4WVG9_CALAY|nr:diphosphomevalonate decarboxylase [Caldithrix abyssi]
MKATAKAHSNIALIKYWGKRDERLNLPAVGSISLTLDALHTVTSVHFDSALNDDELILNDEKAGDKETARISAFLDLIRQMAGMTHKARINSQNNFPTAAGLASSASAFAALALAAAKAAGLSLSRKELSVLARQGSGSAARSVYGGLVEMKRGSAADGRDAYAVRLAEPDYWDLRLLIAVTSEAKKPVGSTAGMRLSERTSPYYHAWVDNSENDLQDMRQAVQQKDFEKVGELCEFSALKMHALALSSNPGLIYWNGATVEGMHVVRSLRRTGLPVWFTIDAGPQLKALCLPEAAAKVTEALQNVPGVRQVIECRTGPDALVLNEEAPL